MNLKLKHRLTAVLLAAAMVFSMPAYAVPLGDYDAENGDISIKLNVEGVEGAVVGVIPTADSRYVLSTKNRNAVGEGYDSDGLYLEKYDKYLTEKQAFYYVKSQSSRLVNYTDIDPDTGKDVSYPVLAEAYGDVHVSDLLGNGAIAKDEQGNIYVAYQAISTREVVPLSYIAQHRDELYPDCTCDFCDVGNQGYKGVCHRKIETEDGETEVVQNTDCPVCNAERRCFAKYGYPTSRPTLNVVKLNADLEQVASFQVTAPSVTGSSAVSAMPYSLTVLADGSVAVGGITSTDFLKDYSPVLSYDYFRNNKTPDYGSIPKREMARGFVLKLDSGLTKITASTYLGGMAIYNSFIGGKSFVSALAADGEYIYAAGGEYSGLIPNTQGSLQPRNASYNAAGSPDKDGFIAKLNSETLQVEKATYYGGSDDDYISALAVRDGVLYAGGSTMSDGLAVSSNAFQKKLNRSLSNNYHDAFVLRLSEDLAKDEQFGASYLGGTGREDLYGICVSDNGEVYFTGVTYATNSFPTTDKSSAGTYFISSFSDDFSRLLYSSLVNNGEGRVVAFAGGKLLAGGMIIENSKYQAFIGEFSPGLAHAEVVGVYRLEKTASSAPVYMGTDKVINIRVYFDNAVEVKGTPRIKLNIKTADGTDAYAEYREPTAEEAELYPALGSGQKSLLFSYTIKDGDTTDGELLECASPDALDLNGGIIKPRGCSDEDALQPALILGNSLGLSRSNVYVNTTKETAEAVTCSLESGTYGVDTVVPVAVRFTGNVTDVQSSEENPIYISMNNGGKAYFNRIDPQTGDLIFDYTISIDDSSIDKLSYVGDIVIPDGCHIKNIYGTEVNPSLPAADSESPMGKKIAVDLQTVKVLSVTADKPAGYYKKGDVINITVHFSGKITTADEARLNLNVLDSAEYVTAPAVKDSDTLTFTFTVNNENTSRTAYLDYFSANSLTLASGKATGENGKAVSLILPQPGSPESLAAAQIHIDTKTPAVQKTDRNSQSGNNYKLRKYYKAGEKLTADVQYTEDVYVKDGAKPTIETEYTLNGKPLTLTYDGYGTSHRVLVFSYTVQDGDRIENGTLKNTAADWFVKDSDGVIADIAGNAARTELIKPKANNNVWAGIYFDTDLPTWKDGQLNAVYDSEKEKIVLTWPAAIDQTSGLNEDAAYAVYRNGEYIASTNALTYTVSTKQGVYSFAVYPIDKAGNQGEPLQASCGVDGKLYTVTVSGSGEGFTFDNQYEVPVVKALNKMSGLSFDIAVAPLEQGKTFKKNQRVTVIWTQMRGNKTVAVGSEVLTAEDTVSQLNIKLQDSQTTLEKGDIIKVFVTEDAFTAVKGDATVIQNGRQ